MKQENDTPKRIPGDPGGYDPVFDTPESGACCVCALHAESGACKIPGAPCLSLARPEGRGVHYIERAGDKVSGAHSPGAGEDKVREALRLADELVRLARKRFPKSPKHPDKFLLELTCAAVHEADLELAGLEPAGLGLAGPGPKGQSPVL